MGATHVDIDTREGYARFALLEPERFDLAVMDAAARSADYTPLAVELETTGRFEQARCESCDADRLQFVVDRSGQRFDVDGEAPPDTGGGSIRVHLQDTDWQDHPSVRPIPAGDPPTASAAAGADG